MKKTFRSRIAWMTAVVMTAASLSISCEEVKPDDGSEDDPIEIPQPGDSTVIVDQISKPDTIYISGEYPVPHPDIPMKIYDTKCVASDAGVSVEAFDITENNFKFTLRPGKDVASYKFDVYPLSILYNYMIDEGGLGADERTVESIILAHLFNAEGAGGYAFTPNDLGEDYEEYTIDWASSTYAQLSPVPDAQYVIVVAGCYDESASESAMTELTMVYVKTACKELVGDPYVDIQVNAQYKGAIISHVPNADCAGFYYFGTNQDMLDPYVDAFGDRMLRDLMRHWYVPNVPIPVDNPEALSYQIGPWDNPDPTLMITTVAFGVDVNGTPAKTLQRVDFHLKEIPEDAEEAMMKYEVDEENMSATYAELNVELSKECRSGFHLLLQMDSYNYDNYLNTGRYYMEGDDAAKAELAYHLAMSGYGIANANFAFDGEEYTGGSYSGKWVEFNLKPDTEYVIAYCGKNGFYDVSELHFSEVFRTKPLVTDRPQDNKSACELTYSDVSTTAITLNFDYDPANTACVRFVCVKYGGMALEYNPPKDDAPHSEWVEFFDRMNGSPFLNVWERSNSGHDDYTLVGMDPGIVIKYAYCAEDMDGVLSEIKIASVTTEELKPGPDPEVELIPEWDPVTRTWTVTYRMVKDCAKFKYMLGTNDDNMYLYRLGTDDMRAYEFYDHWYNYVGELGLETNYESTSQTSVPGEDSVALAVAWGQNEDGSEAISDLFYVILTKDGEAKKISDYYPNYTEK